MCQARVGQGAWGDLWGRRAWIGSSDLATASGLGLTMTLLFLLPFGSWGWLCHAYVWLFYTYARLLGCADLTSHIYNSQWSTPGLLTNEESHPSALFGHRANGSDEVAWASQNTAPDASVGAGRTRCCDWRKGVFPQYPLKIHPKVTCSPSSSPHVQV